MFLYMSVSLQECNYALPYVSISCCLPKLPQYAAVACWLLLFSDNCVTASHEPTSRAPCSGFSIVPMMNYAVPLERFAFTTAIAILLSPFCEAVGSCGPVRVAAEPSGLVNETPGHFGHFSPGHMATDPSRLVHAAEVYSELVCVAAGHFSPVCLASGPSRLVCAATGLFGPHLCVHGTFRSCLCSLESFL